MLSTEMTQKISRYIGRYWGFLALLVWGAALLGFGLIRFTPYALDEGGTRGLILIWSISDRIINPIITLGVPDFRALFFIPLGAYWSGSLVAAKVFTMMLAFAAAALFYRWSRKTASGEIALLASAILLVSPHLLNEIDALGAGVFLLLTFGVAAWLNDTYRRAQRAFGGWFFAQLLWIAITITLHPAGLAYPFALAWSWHKDPVDPRLKRHLLLGIVVVVALVLGMRAGWQTAEWGTNPLLILSQAHHAVAGIQEPNWLTGGLAALLLAAILWLDRRFLLGDLPGLMLLIAVAVGAAAADNAWALLVFALILYRGTALLVNANQSLRKQSLAGQRGIVIVVLFAVTTSFMLLDKGRAQAIERDILSPQDQLIHTLAQEASDPDIPFNAASQWPGRTLIAVRRDVFPLPRAAENGAALLKNIKGIRYLVFDHMDIRNRELSRNIADLTGIAETVYLDTGGVIVHIPEGKNPPDEPHTHGQPKPAPETPPAAGTL